MKVSDRAELEIERLRARVAELEAALERSGGPTGAVEVIRDETEQKRMESALQDSERSHRELLQLANSIILRWSRDGKILYLNEFGQRFFGFTEAEILGHHVMDTIVAKTESTGRDLGPLMEHICANPLEFERNTNENVRRNGERVWIDWTNRVVLDADGQIKEILSIGSDITKRKVAEEEVRKLNAELQVQAKILEQKVTERTAELVNARDEAQSADRLKSAFLAAMSHELRTPLNSIIGFSGILRQGLAGPLNDEQHKQLGMVCSSAEHLLNLINEVLDLSKIEAGHIRLEIAPFNLRELLAEIVGKTKPLADRKGLKLELRLAADVGVIASDKRRVEQVLLNLLSNGIKFTENGGVMVEASRSGESIAIAVSDSGPGIKPEIQGSLFKPFTQLESGLARRHEGTGLGLYICKHLVRMLGGKIELKSEWGKGSTFRFDLPLERSTP